MLEEERPARLLTPEEYQQKTLLSASCDDLQILFASGALVSIPQRVVLDNVIATQRRDRRDEAADALASACALDEALDLRPQARLRMGNQLWVQIDFASGVSTSYRLDLAELLNSLTVWTLPNY